MAKRKHRGVEYRMLIQPTFDETLKKAGTLFLIETVKLFSNFSYEIVVKDVMERKVLNWSLHGLRAPELSMPASGAAIFRKVYFGLKGKYSFVLRKIDGEENTFDLRILASSVSVTEKPQEPFVTVYTSEKVFEANRLMESEHPKRKPENRHSGQGAIQKR
jgi:hypothetical protein